MDKADIIIEDGKIVQVGAELEVPSGMHTFFCKKELSRCHIKSQIMYKSVVNLWL